MGWHHHILLDEEATPRRHSDRVLLARLLRYLTPYRRNTIILLILIFAGIGSTLAIPYLSQLAIDQYLLNPQLPQDQRVAGLTTILILLGTVYLANYLIQYGRTYLTALIGRGVEYDLRMTLFTHLQTLSLSYFDQREIGRIMSRVTNDVDHITELLTAGVVTAVADVVTLIGVVIVMLYINLPLALTSFSILPIMILFVWRFGLKARAAYRLTRRTISSVTSQIEESVSGMREIQAYAKEQASMQDFKRVNVQDREANISAARIESVFFPAVEVFSALSLALILYAGGIQSLTAPFTVSWGVLYAFIQYLNRFFFPLRDLSMFYNNIQSAMSGAERIFDLLDTEIAVREPIDPHPIPHLQGAITFENVTFNYRDHVPVLYNINLAIQPNEHLAVVGPTGAGKTTLINLIYRFYDPQEGQIRIDDIDLRDLLISELRRQMAIVLQDPFLFATTIKENIRYGNPQASDEAIIEIAKTIGIHDFIMTLPDAYDTDVRERGSRLSMGQRQLISFARALLANPHILILDEATSSVDTYTEQLIQQALVTLQKGRTTVVIAHRLSTVRAADRIIVLEHGRIVEQGSHHQLIAKQGVYSRLYLQQFR
jgi:ABC-type multidrug transport system fused ATPase/permease subunit